MSKPIEWTTPRVNSNVNYGLGVTMQCQYKLTNSKKCTILVSTVDNREVYACAGPGVCGKSSQ